MAENGEQRPEGPPEYKIFKSRRGLFPGLRKPDVSGLRGLREKASQSGKTQGREPAAPATAPPERQARRQMGRDRSGGLVLLSFLAFAVSAQLQAFKLSGEAKEALHGNPLMLTSAQTILVLGTDARPPDTKEPRPGGPPCRSASTSRPTATPPTASAPSASSAPTR